jgi:predicted RND superfamily exporter protein
VIGVTLVVIAAIGAGALRLRTNPDSRLFFQPGSPELTALEHVEDTYSKTRSVIFIIAPRKGDIFNREMLGILADATKRAWEVPYATRVDSVTNYKHSYASGDDFAVDELVPDPAKLQASDLERIRAIALSRPELVNHLVSPSGDVAGVLIAVIRPESNLKTVPEVAEAAQRITAQLAQQYPEVEVRLSGGIMADYTMSAAADLDIKRLIPLMVVLIIGCLWLGLRSFYSMAATMAVVLTSMIVALGWAGWLGLILNPVTAAAPIMCMTLAIADCVHVLSTAGQLQRQGLAHQQAIIESLRLNWSPVMMTSVTTAISFLALNFADSPPLNEVGNMVAVGVMAAWILSVTFFPALLAVLPPPKQLPLLSDPRFFTFVAAKVIRFRTPILIGSVLTVVGLAAGIHRMKFDDDFIKYFSQEFAFRADTDFLQTRLTGLHTMYYSVPSGSANGVTDPDYLAKLDAFATWFKAQPKVSHVGALTDILKRLNQNMHRDDPAYYRIPESRNLAAQFLLLYEMSLPSGYDLNDLVDITKSSSLVTVKLANVTSEEIRAHAMRGEEWLAQHGARATATGISVLYADLSDNNIKSMIAGTLVELIVISFLMIFMLRSVKIGIVSLVPNLVPAIMAFGLWGWIGTEVNLAISIVAAMTFGIVVDDTIHTLSKYMRARRELGMSPMDAVRATYVAAGDPMVLAGVTLMLGFGVLGLSGFGVSHQMGVLSAFIIGLAIVADLLLLPPLLLLFDRPRPTVMPAPQGRK